MSEPVMTRAQVDQLLDHARSSIAREMQRCEVSGSGGVVVNGDIVSLPPLTVDEPVARRGYILVIFAQVTMTQNYGTSEPGQVSGIFEYPPRLVGSLDAAVNGDYLAEGGLSLLPRIVAADPNPDEAYAGVVYQENVLVPEPSVLDKFASINFYVRGWAGGEGAPVFADCFAVGRLRLTVVQTQSVVEGEPPAVVQHSREAEVMATYAGAAAIFTAYTNADFYPGDSSAVLNITSARRP